MIYLIYFFTLLRYKYINYSFIKQVNCSLHDIYFYLHCWQLQFYSLITLLIMQIQKMIHLKIYKNIFYDQMSIQQQKQTNRLKIVRLMEGQIKPRRKGISLSLTKDNTCIKNKEGYTPQPIPNLSLYPKNQRLLKTCKPFDISTIDCSLSKDKQIKEGIALDQELYLLKVQLSSKKEIVKNLQREKNQFCAPISNLNALPIQINQIADCNLLQSKIQMESTVSLTPIVHSACPMAIPMTPLTTDIKKSILILNNQESSTIFPISPFLNERSNYQTCRQNNNSLMGRNMQLVSTVKKEVKREESEEKLQRNQNKQNNRNYLMEKMEKLRLAQKKLLEIIKTCESKV